MVCTTSQVDQLKGEKEAMSTDLHRVKNRIGEMSRNIITLNEMKTTIKSEPPLTSITSQCHICFSLQHCRTRWHLCQKNSTNSSRTERAMLRCTKLRQAQ